MKRAAFIAVVFGLALAFAAPAPAQTYKQRLDSLFNNPPPSSPTLDGFLQRNHELQMQNDQNLWNTIQRNRERRMQHRQNLWNSINQPQPRRQIDWRDYTDIPHQQRFDRIFESQRKASEAADLRRYGGCAKYSKWCVNMLRSFGGD